MATNVRELKGLVYSYCISRQGHVAEKCLDGVEKREEGCNFSEVHFIISEAKAMT